MAGGVAGPLQPEIEKGRLRVLSLGEPGLFLPI
jgi:hypothetical protein